MWAERRSTLDHAPLDQLTQAKRVEVLVAGIHGLLEQPQQRLAERQRESEGLMHQGLQAFDDGDVERARPVLAAMVEQLDALLKS